MKVLHDGSVVVFTPENEDDSFWANNLPLEGWQWLGRSFEVDHRIAESLIEAAIHDGLEVAPSG